MIFLEKCSLLVARLGRTSKCYIEGPPLATPLFILVPRLLGETRYSTSYSNTKVQTRFMSGIAGTCNHWIKTVQLTCVSALKSIMCWLCFLIQFFFRSGQEKQGEECLKWCVRERKQGRYRTLNMYHRSFTLTFEYCPKFW